MKHVKLFEEFASNPLEKNIEEGCAEWDRLVNKRIADYQNDETKAANGEYNKRKVREDFTIFVETGDLKKLQAILKKYGFEITEFNHITRTGGFDEEVLPWRANDCSRANLRIKMINRRKLLKFKGFDSGGNFRGSKNVKILADNIEDAVKKELRLISFRINEYSLMKTDWKENDNGISKSDHVIGEIWLYYTQRGEALASDLNIGENTI